MKFVSAVALAVVMLWVPVDGVAQTEDQRSLVVVLLQQGVLGDAPVENNELGRELCRISGQGFCGRSTSVGQGLCYIGGQGFCGRSTSVGQGFSMLGIDPPGQAMDTQWAWDEIDHPSGRMWRCRGIQTGRFAEDYRCSGLPRVDYRWPGEE
jgi:hypothetical protein